MRRHTLVSKVLEPFLELGVLAVVVFFSKADVLSEMWM